MFGGHTRRAHSATPLYPSAPAAFGLAVAERGMVGLYDPVLAEAARGRATRCSP